MMGSLQTHFIEAGITVIPKGEEDTSRTENFRLIILLNIHAKVVKQMLEYHIQKHLKVIA